MTDEYYIPDVKKPKDISNDVGKYTGALKEFIDSEDGSIKVKLEHDVIVERVAHTIYTSWQSGIRELLSLFHKGHSIALMIDQRLSEGIKSKFFGEEAYTTTMPAQFVKKFDCKIVPIYIERINGINFKMKVFEPIKYDKNIPTEKITSDLNSWLERMILNNPSQWIWSHDRWK